jgi:cytochrome d ubiquinol oxidase subunit I
MVGCGLVMAAVSLWAAILAWRSGNVPDEPVLLRALALASPLGMVAIEAGWIVTEVGRQPWIVHNVMRTAEAVTPVPGLWISLVAYTSLYMILGLVVAVLLLYQFRASPRPEDLTARAWQEDH